MMLSINIANANGIPSQVDLVPPSPLVTFTTKTTERIEGYLGNTGRTDSIPNGFSVNKKALNKEPWIFAKTLYLQAHSFIAQSQDGKQYHHPIAIDQALLVKGLLVDDTYYGFIVVEPSVDKRYRWWPLMVEQ